MTNAARASLIVLLVGLTGCEIDPYCLACHDGSVGPAEDAAPDGCVIGATERCNDLDDDCDGRVDEGFDLASDPENCGACGEVCALPHALAACEAGRCVVTRCLPGAADLVGGDEAGCEAFCGVTVSTTSTHCAGPDCCDGADNDCDGEVGEDHDTSVDPENCGGCATSCTAWPCPHVCAAPFAETACEAGVCRIVSCAAGHYDIDRSALNGCEYSCTPTGPEDAGVECNGLDDDCDGEVDEEFAGQGLACGRATPPCEQGEYQCVGGSLRCVGGRPPEPETCNGVDDDCDGTVDDGPDGVGEPCGDDPDGCVRGTMECVDGELRCNDALSPIGSPCGTDEGECLQGTYRCEGAAIACDGSREPGREVCGDGRDNDCDGLIDDADDDLAIGARCDEGTGLGGVGICAWGRASCVDGVVRCVGFAPPADEVCNGVDDDCDGAIDDGIPLGELCGRLEGDLDLWGRQLCLSGSETCVGFVPAREELCDGADNDDDGSFDEEASCPGDGATCRDGRCQLPCSEEANALPCPPGMSCAEGRCVGDLCSGAECGECERCEPSTGLCVEACTGLVCPEGLLCHCGRCWPPLCQVLGCPEDETCRQGRCEADPCEAAACAPSQGCVDGECFNTCERGECGAARYCLRGVCADDPCAGLACPVGRCDKETGECSSACVGVVCLPGMTCDLRTGRCVDDPCLRVRCPEGATCEEGSCIDEPPPTPDGGPDGDADADADATPGDGLWVLATGGGGAVCSVTGRSTVLPFAALLLALLVGVTLRLIRRG